MSMRVFNNLAMKNSTLILDEESSFPSNPSSGQLCFKNGVLYIWATIDGVDSWYPLSNKLQNYVHTQGVSATTWTINHNMQVNDVIVVAYNDTGEQMLYKDITVNTENQIELSFTEATKGKAVVFGASNAYAPAVDASTITADDIVANNSLTAAGVDIVATLDGTKTKLDSMFDWDNSTSTITFHGDLIPNSTDTFTIGSSTKKIKDMYVSASTIYLGDNTTVSGTGINVDSDPNATSESDKPQMTANHVEVKPFTYDPGTGDVTVTPKVAFQNSIGDVYPISFDESSSTYTIGTPTNTAGGSIELADLTSNGSINATELSVNGSSKVTVAQDTGLQGNVDLGTDSNQTVTINSPLSIQQPLTLAGSGTLGDGDDAITVNCGTSNNFQVTSLNFNVTSTGIEVNGNASVSSNLTVSGDLTVNGTTTTVNSEELTVSDNQIILNDGESGDGVTSGNAGIDIDRGTLTNAQLIFDESDDTWKAGISGNLTGLAYSDHLHDGRYLRRDQTTLPTSNDTYDLGSASKKFANVYATTFNGALSGNADTASTLQTARSISLNGDVSGSVGFDGSGDVSMSTTVADDSHSHDTQYYTKTNADNRFLRKNDHALPSTDNSYDLGSSGQRFRNVYIAGTVYGNASTATKLKNARTIQLTGGVTGSASFDGSSDIQISASVVQGAGSGLNADLLDGSDASAFASATHAHDSTYLNITNNLSDLDSASSARTNMGLGTASTKNQSDFAPSTFNVISANTTLNVNQKVVATGGITLTLPSSPTVGDSIQFAPGGDWENNALTIDRNGNNIMGTASNMTCDVNEGFFLIYQNSTRGWIVG